MSSPDPLRQIFRGYLGHRVVFEKHVAIPAADFDQTIKAIAATHCRGMAVGRLDMIEIEFVDEPDISQKFLRLGLNPNGMVRPIAITLHPEAATYSAAEFPLWVVYHNPSDFPGKYVVRRTVATPLPPYSRPDAEPLIVCDTLAEARTVLPVGGYNLGRMDGDEPQIFEVWV